MKIIIILNLVRAPSILMIIMMISHKHRFLKKNQFYRDDEESNDDDFELNFDQNLPLNLPQHLNNLQNGKLQFQPYDYQVELFKNSRDKNSIVFLETGKGKTVVSIMHLYYNLRKYGWQNIKIIFLVTTIQLAEQQYKQILKYIYDVAVYMESNGLVDPQFDLDIDKLKDQKFKTQMVTKVHSGVNNQEEYQGWKAERWENIIESSTIFVMIGQMLLNALRRGYLQLANFGLIIFDECHHARQNHPYRLIVREFYEDPVVNKHIPNNQKVKFLGLTASPVLNLNISRSLQEGRADSAHIENELIELAGNLHSTYVSDKTELNKKNNQVVYYEQPELKTIYLPQNQFLTSKYQILDESFKKYQKCSFQLQVLLDQIKNCLFIQALMVFYELGLYSYFVFIDKMSANLETYGKKFLASQNQTDVDVMSMINQTFLDIKEYSQQFGMLSEKNFSVKLNKLLQTLKIVDKDQNLIIIFVESKIITKYLNELLKGLGFNSTFVVGSGNKTNTSVSQKIIKQSNLNTLTSMKDKLSFVESAQKVYNQFSRNGDVEELAENNQLQALQELEEQGVEKYEKLFQEKLFDHKEQNIRIEDFKQKRYNILVSTNVTEEGFDIPDCNIILVYGTIRSFKQYIQQRGRARKQDSVMYVFENTENKVDVNQIITKIEIFEKTLEIIYNKINSLEFNKYKKQMDKTYEMCLTNKRFALINTNWAIEILSNYLNQISPERRSLKQDSYVRGIYDYYFYFPQIGYKCVLILPATSRVRYFSGLICPQKEQAKRSAAFHAVKQLKKQDLLTDDLRPNLDVIEIQNYDQKEDQNLKDENYREIINKFAVIKKQEGDQNLTQKYFPTKDNILLVQEDKPFYLYKFIFNDQDIPYQKQLNYRNRTDVGFIHNYKIENNRFIAGSEVQLVMIKKVELDYEEYKLLQKIHMFLYATQKDWDIQFFAKIFKQDVNEFSSLYQQNKKKEIIDELQLNTHSLLLVLLQNDDIDKEQNESILNYLSKMDKVYKLLNNIRQWKQENKIIIEENERLNQKNPNKKWNKIFSDDQVKQYVSKVQQFDEYLVQNISEQYHLGKLVLRGIEEKQKDKLDLEEKSRISNLKSIIKDEFDDKSLLDGEVLNKFLKNQIGVFTKQDRPALQQKKQKYRFYQGELIQYPINLSTCFKIRILLKHVMFQVKDYLISEDFKINQLKQQIDINFKVQKYTISNNLLISESDQIFNYLQAKYPYIAKKLQENHNIPQKKLQLLEPKLIQNQVYDTQGIRTPLINQCFQAQSYNPNEKTNYQVLEIYGDAILKMLASVEVFVTKPNSMEGILHVSRAGIISNDNLRRVAIINKFYLYTFCTKLQYSSPEFKVSNIQKEEADQKFTLIQNTGQINHIPDNYQFIPEKVHADIIEALNGAHYYQFQSVDACQTFLFKMGLLKWPLHKIQLIPIENQVNLAEPIKQNFDKLQSIIGYKFKNLELLIQAVSHISFLNIVESYQIRKTKNIVVNDDGYSLPVDKEFTSLNKEKQDQVIQNMNDNKIRPDLSYERLEFLGDAVLDFFVIDWLVTKYPNDNPGDLSLKKQCIVCNKALSLVTLHYKLDQFILHESIHDKQHDNYVQIQKIKENWDQYYDDIGLMYNESMIKILGDIFESITGAIYLDSGLDFDLMKQILNRLLQPFMEHFSSPQQVLKNPQHKLQKYYKDKYNIIIEIKWRIFIQFEMQKNKQDPAFRLWNQ
ncbi:hypothetical protein pb186bvf_009145 [Paramecium bursaria]